jgi:hypothetical protein
MSVKAKQHRDDIPLVPKVSAPTRDMIEIYSREKSIVTVSLNTFTEQGGLDCKRELILYPQNNIVPKEWWDLAKQRPTIQSRLDSGKLTERAITPDPHEQVVKREVFVNETNQRAERVLLTE